jgi:hypothetical protein
MHAFSCWVLTADAARVLVSMITAQVATEDEQKRRICARFTKHEHAAVA